MKKIILVLIPTLTISCSTPLDKPFKEATLEEDMVKLKKALSEEELEILTGYVTLKSLANDKMLGKTYGDLLKEAKELREELRKQEEEQNKLAEQARIEEDERIKRLGEALAIGLFEKDFLEYNYQEYITYKFVFQNKTDKNIRAFTGTVYINDLFDKEITSFNLTYDDGVTANSTKNWNAQTDFNEFIDKDVTLKNKDIEDLKIKWVPKKIIFTDNSTLE